MLSFTVEGGFCQNYTQLTVRDVLNKFTEYLITIEFRFKKLDIFLTKKMNLREEKTPSLFKFF